MIETKHIKQQKYIDEVAERVKKAIQKNMTFDEAYNLSQKHLMQGMMTKSVSMVEKGLLYGVTALSILKAQEQENNDI